MEVHFTPDVQAKLDRLAMTGYDFHPEVENDFAEIWDFINRGKGVAGQIARLLSVFKGTNGGRFYVNEFCSAFPPVSGTDGLEYVYIGQIDLNSWFADPLALLTTATSQLVPVA
jgi:hypothetical protein